MSADVEQLQVEIAEFEALLTEPAAQSSPRRNSERLNSERLNSERRDSERRTSEWRPTPEPQPWLVASSA